LIVRVRLRPSVYALYMAVFVVGGTAALGPHHILYASLEPEWLCGFLIVLGGAYAAARIPAVAFRLLVITLAGAMAWIFGTLWPFGWIHASAQEFLREVADWRGFFSFTSASVLALAILAEFLLMLLRPLARGTGERLC